MPKRVGYLYEKMLDKTLIKLAITSGAKNKHQRWDVKPVIENIDLYVDRVYNMVKAGSYCPSKPDLKEVYDTCGCKTRIISVVPFYPDGIMHQLMVLVMQPVLMRGMYHWSCASIPNRGGNHAVKRIKKLLKADPKNTKYVCKMDVKKFYPSIKHELLIQALTRKIKDQRFLDLVGQVLKTCNGGLAIGYFVCQWFANYFLEPLDHYIMTLDGVKYMIRYMDDIVIFGSNKRKLHRVRAAIQDFLAVRLQLNLKENWQVFPLKHRMLDFVGFRFNHTHVILRRRNFLRFIRQCRKALKRIQQGKPISFKLAAGLLSRSGQLRHCNSAYIKQKYFDPIGVNRLKEVVRNESQRRLEAQKCILDRRPA